MLRRRDGGAEHAQRGTRRYDRYYTSRRKGASVCANNLPAPMADTAVMRVLEDTLLNPVGVERALAHAEALILDDRTGEQRAALEAQLAETDATARRLTAAIATGGELAPLVAGPSLQSLTPWPRTQ